MRRRRRPDALLAKGQGRGQIALDYETQKAYHREKIDEKGDRVGEYGYIDPLGVRRVVTYSTGSRGELQKEKENDFVGIDTYFHSV